MYRIFVVDTDIGGVLNELLVSELERGGHEIMILRSLDDDVAPTAPTQTYSGRDFTPHYAKKSKRGKFKRQHNENKGK